MNKSGFTLIELLISIGILAIITTFGATFFSTGIGQNELVSTSWEVIDTLRRAQSSSLSGKGNSAWSVHFETNQFVLFKGVTYNVLDPDNVFFPLSTTIEVSDISLNGGGSDVFFNKVKGTTTKFGTVTLLDTNTGETRVINISKEGVFIIS